MGRVAFAALVTAAAMVIAAEGAVAATSGWWTSSPVTVVPDAPAGGLVLEGGSDESEPRSYAAVAYALEPGSVPQALTVTVAPGSASTPGTVLALCPITEPFIEATGGPMADAPTFDCGSRVEAAASADGSSYRFDLTGLIPGDNLAVALLPTAAVDRVVLDRPSADALETSTTTAGPEEDELLGARGPQATIGGAPGSAAGLTAFDVPGPPPPQAVPAVAATTPGTVSRIGATATVAEVVDVAAGEREHRRSVLGAVSYVGLVFLLAALWHVASRTRRDVKGLA